MTITSDELADLIAWTAVAWASDLQERWDSSTSFATELAGRIAVRAIDAHDDHARQEAKR